MSKKGKPTSSSKNEEQELKTLLESYIRKSEELEKQESQVLKQVELMHSAVASLRNWNQSRKPSTTESVHVDVEEIEEETRRIKEETEKIQKEVEEKMEENKRLQEEIQRRKLAGEKKEEDVSESFLVIMEEEARLRRAEREELESRAKKAGISLEKDPDPSIRFFSQKLRKLEEMEKKLKRESRLESAEAKKKEKNLKEKIEMLEYESRIDKQLIDALKAKLKKK